MIRTIVQVSILLYPLLGFLRLYFNNHGFSKFGSLIGYIGPVLIAIAFLEYLYSLRAEVRKVKTIDIAICILIIATSAGLIYWNSINYPNYLYSNFGITVYYLNSVQEFIVVYLILLLLLKFLGRRFSLTRALRIMGVVFLIIIIVKGVLSIDEIAIWATSSYEDKIGEQYNYFEYITKYTPENVKIVIPTQDDYWSTYGNQPLSRYFLYPRTLISGVYLIDINTVESITPFYYLSINRGYQKWPYVTQNKVSFDGKSYFNLNQNVIYSDNDASVIKVTK